MSESLRTPWASHPQNPEQKPSTEVSSEIEQEEMTEDQKWAKVKWDDLYGQPKPSAAVSSEIVRAEVSALKEAQERRLTVAYLTSVLEGMHELRARPGFWVGLGPAFRVRFEDFQGELATLRAAWRE